MLASQIAPGTAAIQLAGQHNEPASPELRSTVEHGRNASIDLTNGIPSNSKLGLNPEARAGAGAASTFTHNTGSSFNLPDPAGTDSALDTGKHVDSLGESQVGASKPEARISSQSVHSKTAPTISKVIGQAPILKPIYDKLTPTGQDFYNNLNASVVSGGPRLKQMSNAHMAAYNGLPFGDISLLEQNVAFQGSYRTVESIVGDAPMLPRFHDRLSEEGKTFYAELRDPEGGRANRPLTTNQKERFYLLSESDKQVFRESLSVLSKLEVVSTLSNGEPMLLSTFNSISTKARDFHSQLTGTSNLRLSEDQQLKYDSLSKEDQFALKQNVRDTKLAVTLQTASKMQSTRPEETDPDILGKKADAVADKNKTTNGQRTAAFLRAEAAVAKDKAGEISSEKLLKKIARNESKFDSVEKRIKDATDLQVDLIKQQKSSNDEKKVDQISNKLSKIGAEISSLNMKKVYYSAKITGLKNLMDERYVIATGFKKFSL
ncbi:hypothetical protein [Noviherbaspirillum galbum]|uniref:Uncharacterized protein n=1 Tax=Noviherbaspirillum galbum TaxID=2709383 RepID=A0A6B3SJD4_9BURK|nr:hypothetical protein [Noviherbaspirillum galbum]NEX60820.1 hypothetical protein [Noviherbaspirillum galbum]